MPGASSAPDSSEWIAHTRLLLDSWDALFETPLIRRTTPEADAATLFDAPFVVVSHGTQDDPILNYGNRAAVDLWELPLELLLQMPSRKTAEPVHRDERAELLRRTREDGYIDDYSGIRISATGRRFRIHQATVWNLTDKAGQHAGQAAAFSQWTDVPAAEHPDT